MIIRIRTVYDDRLRINSERQPFSARVFYTDFAQLLRPNSVYIDDHL